MTAGVRVVGALVASAIAIVLGVVAAWPIYQTTWMFVPAAAALLLGWGLAAVCASRQWGPASSTILLLGVFVVAVVPVALPHAFERLPLGPLLDLPDALAAVVVGWKQLLTLSLPVGTYQTVLVPAFVVWLLTAFGVTTVALRSPRFVTWAAALLLVPVAFATVFGASEVSRALGILPAPREIGVWIAAAALGAAWVAWVTSAERRAALRRGRPSGSPRSRGGQLVRGVVATLTVAFALGIGIAVAPALSDGPREVPRDRIDPEVVLRDRPSPLASYRVWKRDDALDTPLFTIAASGADGGASDLPPRLRLAVLDAYDGVDFHVSTDSAGRFTRFPSAEPVTQPTGVRVRVAEGYADIWAPTAALGSAPRFTGPRADALADAFFVNRATGSAIAVPGGRETGGLVAGDGYEVLMSAAPDPQLVAPPAANAPLVDLTQLPELAAWVAAQGQAATPEGLQVLVTRLRERGYLSHSLNSGEGQRLWLERLAAAYGTQFEPSAGGHSIARIEQLFGRLNAQQRLAGEDATPAALVAAVGDDEQFATAAALIARSLGYDARVVMGVRLDPGDDPGNGIAGVPGVPACAAECTGEHLAAWVEVRGDDGVWVPIDVTPQVSVRPTVLTEGQQLPEFSTTPEQRDAREVDPPVGIGERADNSEPPEPLPGPSWLWPLLRAAALVLLALVFLAVPFVFLPLAKHWRARHRLAERDPELRTLAAWHEMVDRAADAGVRIPAGATRREIAEALGTAPARWAAEQVDRAVFSPAGVDMQTADWVWQAALADAEERRHTLTNWQRIRAAYALRSYGMRLRRGGRRPRRDERGALGYDEGRDAT